MRSFIIAACFLLMHGMVWAQSRNYNETKKGQVYILWGWNRGFFTKSNIHFKGDDYDFTLYKVKAHDRPTLPVSYHNYFEFDRLTIPQTNFKLGYFIKDNLAISIEDDHMKYVMDQDQVVKMKGSITRPGPYEGDYNGNKKLTEDFLTFEHTNGLNYLNVEIEKFYSLYHSKSNKCIVRATAGAGVGILFPRTDAKLLDYAENDRFHVAGFGVAISGGIQATFFKHLVVKFEDKIGFIDMPDILLHTKGINGRAKQTFFFTEPALMIGGTFGFGNKRKNK